MIETIRHPGQTGLRDPAYDEMLAFRRRLLRHPLGLDFTAPELQAEAAQIHLALRGPDGAIIATLLLVLPDATGTARLRQMAVEPAFRRRGLGASLVVAGEAELRRQATLVTLAARAPAIPFYEKLGYMTKGERYIELTIPHIRMEKPLIPIHPKA